MEQPKPQQAKIGYLDLQITGISLGNKIIGHKNIAEDFKLTLNFSPVNISKDQVAGDDIKKHDNLFGISYILEVKGETDIFNLKIEAIAIFKSDIEITPEFLGGTFAKINAPAISFPYLRAFISTLTLNAGYSPIILPAFNFNSLNIKQEGKGE